MADHVRPQADLPVALRRYLPAQLAELLSESLDLTTALACDAHLDALLRAVATYLPRYLVQDLLLDPRPGQVSGQFREATIMFADISGFTAMSERLSRRGQEGAEKITDIVGDYFTAMLDITARQGGDLLKFGGDALLLAFFGPEHALRACRAAAQMQQAIGRFDQVEAFGDAFHLQMTVGLGSGPLFTANLGTPARMEYTVMGQALTSMAHAEDQAEGGEIAIDEATYHAAGDAIEAGAMREGCYLVTTVHDSDQPYLGRPPHDPIAYPETLDGLPALRAHLVDTAARLDVLVPFLPPGLLDLLCFDPTSMSSRQRGEFRPVTVMFANFYGIDEIIRELGPGRAAEITAILNAHFSRMQEIIDRYEGVIDKVDSYVVGHRIMALFGAPRAHVDDPERAVRAAWEMQAAMSTFGELQTSAGTFTLKQRVGINTGRVFAGNVGSDTRHEYSVMGDEVNLTARLMSAAREGQVLTSQSTADEVGRRFRLDEQAPVRVKGKSQPVPNYLVQDILERDHGPVTARRPPLVGRAPEWAAVKEIAQRALTGQPQVLALHGEMGMGKSRVLEELRAQWTARGGTAYTAACLSYGRHTPYAPWAEILRQLFGLQKEDGSRERAQKIQERLAAANPAWLDWAALPGALLGADIPESALLRSLDPKLRQQNLKRMVTGLIAAHAAQAPILLVLDDVQWIDQVSLALLQHLCAHRPAAPLLVCLAYRPEQIDLGPLDADVYTAVALEPLSEAGSLALLDGQLPTAPEMPKRLKELILRNAQGNPLFIVEMAHALIENYLIYDPARDAYVARTDLDRVQVPDTVSRVILSRLDRLDEQSRNMLKVASVIGRAFQQWLLQSIYPYQTGEAEMEAQLLDMCAKDLLDRSEIMYLFRHVMTREVAYESLLYADRRRFHGQIARSIESQPGVNREEYLEVLAEHYTLAENWPQALRYQLQAGQRAQSVYANEDAVHRYQKAIEIARQIRDDESQIQAGIGLGDTCQLVGKYGEALDSYATVRTLLEGCADTPQARCRRADLCHKIARVHEYQGDYDQALDWVNQGLDLLAGEEGIEAAQLRLGGAAVFQREGKWPAVIDWAQRSREIAAGLSTSAAQRVAAHADYLLGNSYRRIGEADQAARCYERSLETYRALQDQPGMARAYNNLATFYRYQDDWERATGYYQQALETLARVGDTYGQAVVANNLAEVLLNRGQLDQARAQYQHSLDMARELGISGLVALLHNNLGHTAIRAGEWGPALAELQTSQEMFARLGAEEFLPELYRHMAEAYLGLDDLAQAGEWAAQSLERAVAAQTRLEEGCTRRVLGAIHQAAGRLDEAQTELDQSLELLTRLSSPYQVALTQVQRAGLYEVLGEPVRAADLRGQAAATFEHLGAKLDHARATGG